MDNLIKLLYSLAESTSLASDQLKMELVAKSITAIMQEILIKVFESPKYAQLEQEFNTEFDQKKNPEDQVNVANTVLAKVEDADKASFVTAAVDEVLTDIVSNLVKEGLLDEAGYQKFQTRYAELMKSGELLTTMQGGSNSASDVLSKLANPN